MARVTTHEEMLGIAAGWFTTTERYNLAIVELPEGGFGFFRDGLQMWLHDSPKDVLDLLTGRHRSRMKIAIPGDLSGGGYGVPENLNLWSRAHCKLARRVWHNPRVGRYLSRKTYIQN